VADPVTDTITFSPGLSDWQRAELARHLEQTRHMNYGGTERVEALYFGLPFGDPGVVRTEAPAVLLAELAEAARTGEPVAVPRMTKSDRVRVSELLRQSAARPAREGNPWSDATARELAALAASWDERFRLPVDELERAEYVALPRGAVG
jgi:hypothetical protein